MMSDDPFDEDYVGGICPIHIPNKPLFPYPVVIVNENELKALYELERAARSACELSRHTRVLLTYSLDKLDAAREVLNDES